ncbi:NAD(P)/FAD-dependent oxidoreductase [Anatilimnocola sp. NA78]|uniref:NAD(P)/FAD-dependent oxidoreductase n=1 Tax=Anatilimnocola sp. NA78 TaxID=3415683 RepID=UPI003CE508CA
MSNQERVVVVGGGVIGAACAYYLHQAGRNVTLIDQGAFGKGCSHGNCGYVCPSHVLPLATPGALWNTMKTLLARNSPLKVRWRLDPAMWRWFWQFARKCNQRDMLQAGHAIQALLGSSRTLYDDLFHSTLAEVEWEPLGLLFVFLSQHGMEHYAATDTLLRNEFGIGAKRLDGQALLDLEPSLKLGIAGAWHYESDGHLRPDKLMLAWRHALERDGVEIREQCELRDLTVDRRLAKQLVTSQGEIAADQIVIATGAWTPQLNRLLRRPIPIQPGKGYSLTMGRPAICPKYSMLFEEHRVAVTPLASTYRIGSTMEFAGYDSSLNPARVQLLKAGAEVYLREPHNEPVLETWAGWRPMTPDSLPFLGLVPALDNVYLAAGHGMLGVSMSPGTGKLLAELVTGATPHIDPQPYAVGRPL